MPAPAEGGPPPRVIAVDWSGAAGAGAARKIWLAEVAGGRVARLVGGRTREAVTADLAACVRESAAAGAPLVVGLDFAFSLPAWFLDEAGAADGPALWALAERDGDRWLVSVHDRGIGIDPAEADRVFDMFQRASSRDRYPGAGIGLATSRRIVERHGGRIWVEGREGGGTTVRVTLAGAS